MVDTPKRTRGRRDTHSPQDTSYKTQYQEWSAVLPKPPLTAAQLRQEYDDALSFLLLLESRINRLEQIEGARATKPGESVAAMGKLYFLSARSRSAKEASAKRQARRAEMCSTPALVPPYNPATTPDALVVITLLEWVCESLRTSEWFTSQPGEQQQATAGALSQLCRSVVSHVQLPMSGTIAGQP